MLLEQSLQTPSWKCDAKCTNLSVLTNRTTAFVSERREFKNQQFACRITLPRPILLAGDTLLKQPGILRNRDGNGNVTEQNN